ncbi:MAG: signal transduction histidine kinase/AmiR/NasT family two-component response regulator [Brevundimonas sp.]|jgi:signal transduction histidine kinase/AmiR/NasT family two-component response regulator|uniref:hybrid sensor histidine kinase/response regulator n=1 Tax=Brevundimonas sp. TaxID=1871086 RepID=UPI0039E3C306
MHVVRAAFIAALILIVTGAFPTRAETPARTAMELAEAVEARAGATSFDALYAFGREAMTRNDREGLNRLYHVTWISLNQGEFEQARLWNGRLAEAANRLGDERYQAIANLNALTIRYDEGDTAAAAEMERISQTAEDWFVQTHAVRIYALALMDQDRIGEGLELLADMDSRVPDDAPYARTAHGGLWEMTGIGLMKLNDVAGATAAFGRFEIDYNKPDYPRPDFDSLYNLARLSTQIGQTETAHALYLAHNRLAERTGMQSLIVYDANLCAMTAEARRAWRDVLACLEPYGETLGAADFLAAQMLPRRAIARARLGMAEGAARDLARIERLQAAGEFREEGVSRVPLARAELLFAQGRDAEAYRVLRDHFLNNETATAVRFAAGINQVTGDMQAQLDERRRQLEMIQTNAGLQDDVIQSQRWIVGIAVVFLICAGVVLVWQVRQSGRLRESRRRAQEANQAKSAFLANMSHEIRTPLNGVVAMADALARADLRPREHEMAEVIRSSGKTLERLLSDILDSAKIESGQITVERAPFHLGEAVHDITTLWRLRAEEKDVLLEERIDPALNRVVDGDAVRVRQILANLVSNALKFTSHGRITLTVATSAGDRVRFEVRDTGIGFDAEQKARIFTRFQQADGSITRRFGGTGLGLAISRDLARLMGGTLDCDSTPGEGSVFWFEIPLPPAEAETAEAAPAPVERADLASMPLKVLLADDHPANRKVIEVMLSQTAMALTAVVDGAEAVQAYGDEDWDLVLMDMQMPVMDGLTATREIRALEMERGRTRTPILMLTANALDEHVQAGREAGADGHLAKPITLAGLFEAMGAALAGREEIRETQAV